MVVVGGPVVVDGDATRVAETLTDPTMTSAAITATNEMRHRLPTHR